jgi:hypothetical protein
MYVRGGAIGPVDPSRTVCNQVIDHEIGALWLSALIARHGGRRGVEGSRTDGIRKRD